MTVFATSAAIGEREQLADIIYRIDPAETPIFSNVKKETSNGICLLYTSPSPRDLSTSRMPSSA